MKKSSILLSLVMLFGIIFMGSCAKDNCERTVTYTNMTPVYMSYEDFRSSVALESARDLANPGKIYLYGKYLFINEVREGIHVIDMSNPANPQNIAFIKILGNVDIAIKDNVLLADSFMDIIALDISDMNNVKEIHRMENAYSNDWNLGIVFDENEGVVVEWIPEEITEVTDCDSNKGGGVFWGGLDNSTVDFESDSAPQSSSNNGSNGPGVAGSFARFSIVNNHLYTIDNYQLHSFDITNPAQPNNLNQAVSVGWNVETIFPYKDFLFFGSQNGMIVYSISNPDAPTHVSQLQHFRGCDPVVVQDDIAYVTLRNGNPTCGGFENQLDIIDVSDIYNPDLIKSYDMHNPHGLGIDENTLFLCDGEDGLKVFDVEDSNNIDEMEHYKNIDTYDVIPLDDYLFMIGSDGFRLYDYSDLEDIHLLSTIPVVPEQ